MRSRWFNIITFLAFLSVIFIGDIPLKAQQKHNIDILQSDRYEGGTYHGIPVRKLVGHVILKSGDRTMVCDSAYQFIGRDQLRAFGNIQISTEGENIWADTVIYHPNADQSRFLGRVIIVRDTVSIFSDEADYSFNRKIAYFPHRLRLEDKRGTLVADSGRYYQKIDSVIFKGNVQVADSSQYAEADSLFSNRKSGHYKLYGRVYLRDDSNHVALGGHYMEADSTGYRKLTGDAHMEKFKKQPRDTDFVWSNTIIYRKIDTTYAFKAIKNVHIWNHKFSSISDTADYIDSTSTFILRSHAKAWYQRIQLSGPHIEVKFQKDTVRTLVAYPKPFTVQEDSATGSLNQIKGDTLHAWFEKGDISRILVHPNSKMIYFTKNKQNKPDGAVEMTSDSLLIYFKKGNVTRVKGLNKIDGNYYEESKDLEKRRLKGFTWDPKERPVKPSKPLAPRLPPVPANRPFTLPDRYKTYIEKTGKTRKIKLPQGRHSPS